MADGSRHTAAALQQDAGLHAQAHEVARRVYGDWPTVATDSVKLAADLRNVRACKDAVEIIASRYEAAAMLERDPTPGNNLEENQRRNILQCYTTLHYVTRCPDRLLWQSVSHTHAA
jgi:hypothetical protein